MSLADFRAGLLAWCCWFLTKMCAQMGSKYEKFNPVHYSNHHVTKLKKEHVALPRDQPTWCLLVRGYAPNIHSAVAQLRVLHTSSLQARRACQVFRACWSGQVMGERVNPFVWIIPVLHARQGGLPISGQSFWNVHLQSTIDKSLQSTIDKSKHAANITKHIWVKWVQYCSNIKNLSHNCTLLDFGAFLKASFLTWKGSCLMKFTDKIRENKT